jgi:hypothetical protein
MITYTPKTPMEAAVLETGHFEITSDTAGREVVCVGHNRLPKVVLVQKAEGLHGLIEAIGRDLGRSFTAIEGDPWEIESIDTEGVVSPESAEDYLVMGLQPVIAEGRPVRVAAGRELVRLFLAPWTVPALSLDFGSGARYALNTNRNVIGDWSPTDHGLGMVVGVPEVWCSILERHRHEGTRVVYRCDVPMPWVSPNGLTNAVPTAVGVYEVGRQAGDRTGTWIAKLPVFLAEGTAVEPVQLPEGVDVVAVPDGPWELEVVSTDFDMNELD